MGFFGFYKKMSLDEIEVVVLEAQRKNQILGISAVEEDNDELEPWKLLPSKIKNPAPIIGALPESIDIVVGSQLFVAKDKLSPALRNRIIRLAAFQNPEFYKAQSMRLPVFNKPRIISCSEEFPNHLALPKGCLEQLLELLQSLQIKTNIKDERLDTLFLTMPISWKGTVVQYAGRLHRLYDSKKEVVIVDYLDHNIAVFEKMFTRRCRGYKMIGYQIDEENNGLQKQNANPTFMDAKLF